MELIGDVSEANDDFIGAGIMADYTRRSWCSMA